MNSTLISLNFENDIYACNIAFMCNNYKGFVLLFFILINVFFYVPINKFNPFLFLLINLLAWIGDKNVGYWDMYEINEFVVSVKTLILFYKIYYIMFYSNWNIFSLESCWAVINTQVLKLCGAAHTANIWSTSHLRCLLTVWSRTHQRNSKISMAATY